MLNPVPQSPEVAAEHEACAHDACREDCIGCRIRAIVDDAEHAPTPELVDVVRSLASATLHLNMVAAERGA